ncbi:MAG: zinc-ribbon domain-containing protein [Chloroflexi bacterium]|nr:MAG: zinc-ribbon domain-containing protein [Chloroflexota bacterium]
MGPKFPSAPCPTGGPAVWLRPARPPRAANERPYNGSALSSAGLAGKGGTVFCRECGKSIEDDARFCRFCGKSQKDPVAGSAPAGSGPSSAAHSVTASSLETALRQVFPRHQLQDEFMHIGTIAAFLMALVGFVVGFFYAYSWLGTNFLLGSIALLLFLILRESTLSQIRMREGGSSTRSAGSPRSQAPAAAAEGPAEAANAESSPPRSARPPATPR